MNNIDTTTWKRFKLNDIFVKQKIKKYSSSPEEEGLIPYITSTSNNNGVDLFVNEKPSFNKKCLTISTNGRCFDVFLQNYGEFCVSSDVEILYNPNLSDNQYLFIATIIKLDQYRWGYGRKPKNDKVFETEIKLPSKNDNPDWEFMENYINKLRKQERENTKLTLPLIDEKINISIVNWKKVNIGDLFEVSRGKRIVRDVDYFKEQKNDYKFPVITSTTINNSVDGYYNKYNCNGNVICCGGEASGMYSTYQKSKCWVMDRSRILKPKFDMNERNALFFISILNLNQYKFSYGRSANPDDIEKLEIVIPINKNNDVDFEFIDKLMREREREECNRLYDLYLK